MNWRITLIAISLLTFTLNLESQEFSQLWTGYYSYFDVVDVTRSDTKLYAATENSIFSYDVNTREIETITTIEGLSGESISTIEYSFSGQLLLIGYENGLIEIYFESDQSILSVVDIIEKESIDPTIKEINDFYEFNGFVYISTNFGISVYDIDRLEFGDTYFIGENNTQIPVAQTAVFNGFIYAACPNGNGLRKASFDNPNLIDSTQWDRIRPGSFNSVEIVNDRLYVLFFNSLREVINDFPEPRYTFARTPTDSEVVGDKMYYTNRDGVFVFNIDAELLLEIEDTEEFQTRFTSATAFGNDIYIGNEDFGILQTIENNIDLFQEIRPEGPLFNSPFRLQAFRDGLWVTFGEYDQFLNPSPLTRRGISILDQETWNNISYENLLDTPELNSIQINPFNPSQTFISSFYIGLLEFENFEPVMRFDNTNSPLESLINPGNPNSFGIRTGTIEFDDEGNLWSISSKVGNALRSYNPATGNWQSFSFDAIFEDPFSDLGYHDMTIGTDGTKWIGCAFNGLVGYNENQNPPIKRIFTVESGFPLANADIRTVAVDNNGTLWIGTRDGLRVLFNPSNFFEDDNPVVEPIIFIEDGLARELLENQLITDIEVDGANNKWIGTFDSGVFYFTPDGQRTIYHFTKDNSPLPTNAINDISIDQSNGTVYFATPKGLLSFKAGGSAPAEELSEAYAYPNPVRPEYDILGSNDLNDINKGIKIAGLTDNVNVKITDIAGNLVAEAQSRVNSRNSNLNYNFAIEGGTGIWNGKNLANNIVASGVYLIIISDLDSFESKVIKLLIVR